MFVKKPSISKNIPLPSDNEPLVTLKDGTTERFTAEERKKLVAAGKVKVIHGKQEAISNDDWISGEDHDKVKISGANMSGVAWNKLGGRPAIEAAILDTWNNIEHSKGVILPEPTFTSGFRDKNHKLSKARPTSKHIQRTAFDLRSKDLGSEADNIFASLMGAFSQFGITGQHEKGNVNEDKRTGEHFHFQLAAKGFGGVVNKATGFIAGEEGPELVNIIPLQSPNDKMNAMNALNAENQTLQGQSGSPTIINTTNAQATTTNQGDFVGIIPKPVAAPKLTTSLPS